MVRIKESSGGVEQGMKFGDWEVIGKPFSIGKPHFYVTVRCKCGCVEAQRCVNLKIGHAQRCKRCSQSTHGGCLRERRSALYVVWASMKTRCYNPNRDRYGNYGARGIEICEEWQGSFEAFRDWSIANGYKPGLQIDRRDNDGNYEPSNCRWVTCQVNARNKSNNRILTAFGEAKCLAEWAEDPRCAVSLGTLDSRLRRGWSDERAISSPNQSNRQKSLRR